MLRPKEDRSLAQGHKRGVSVQDRFHIPSLKLPGKCPQGIIIAVILYSLSLIED